MWPFYGYAQPKIARTPTSWSYENVVAVGAKKATVDAFHIFGHAIVVGSREVIIVFNIHHIGYIVAYAMPQRVVRAQQAMLVGNGGNVFVEHLLRVYDGTDLQEVKFARAIGVYVAGKFYFHGSLHGLFAIAHGHLHDLRKRESVVPEHTAEGDKFASAIVKAIANDAVVRVVCGGDKVQRMVSFGLLYTQFQHVKAIVYGKVGVEMLGVESVELRLRVAQSRFHLACLQHLVGVIRTNAECLTAIHNVFSQSKGKVGNAVFGSFVANRVIVDGTKHAADVGVESSVVVFTHHGL